MNAVGMAAWLAHGFSHGEMNGEVLFDKNRHAQREPPNGNEGVAMSAFWLETGAGGGTEPDHGNSTKSRNG
jgi:hypothetical protein